MRLPLSAFVLALLSLFAFGAHAKVTCATSQMDDKTRCETDFDKVRGGILAPVYGVSVAGDTVMFSFIQSTMPNPAHSETLYIRIDGGELHKFDAVYRNSVSCGGMTGCIWTNTYVAMIPAALLYEMAAGHEVRIATRTSSDGALMKPESFARWLSELAAKGITPPRDGTLPVAGVGPGA